MCPRLNAAQRPVEQRLLILHSFPIGLIAIQIGRWLGAGHQRQRAARLQRGPNQSGINVVFIDVVLAPILFELQVKIFIPVKLGRQLAPGAKK
jgi:hypothetical protein